MMKPIKEEIQNLNRSYIRDYIYDVFLLNNNENKKREIQADKVNKEVILIMGHFDKEITETLEDETN